MGIDPKCAEELRRHDNVMNIVYVTAIAVLLFLLFKDLGKPEEYKPSPQKVIRVEQIP